MSTFLNIPSLGDLLTLASDWKIEVQAEPRNSGLMEVIEGRAITDQWNGDWDYQAYAGRWRYVFKPGGYPKKFVVPANTVLRVERIYVRQNNGKPAKEFDSVTFRVMSSPDERIAKPGKQFGKGGQRFWVSLADANRLEVSDDET